MPRTARMAPGGMIFHVLNRANARTQIFDNPKDYAALERVMQESVERVRMRVLAYALMPNHWHMVLWPREDGDLGNFVQHLTTTHVRRWHLHRHTVGNGHLYQGTYKSFPVESDEHLLTVLRYVEANALRAALVKRAEAWPWSSLWCWRQPNQCEEKPLLAAWPVDRPRNWLAMVNAAMKKDDLERLRTSVGRGRPYGTEAWAQRTAKQLGLQSTFRSRGRPRRQRDAK